MLGTLGYLSPEQVRGQAADLRSDLFAFGAVLCEMLAGRRAFRGDSTADTMSAILREDPPDLSLADRSISPALDRIVRHCLEKERDNRFQSAKDVANNLEALMKMPTYLSAGWLRIDPNFDPLRKNPRFQKLVARADPLLR